MSIYCARLPESTVNSLCGAVAGMASGFVTCPLDVIKTRLQAQGSFRRIMRPGGAPPSALYRGFLGTARTIWIQDGLRGMYRGLGPMLLGYLPTWAVYMSVYDEARTYWAKHVVPENKWTGKVYASITAGACSTLVTNPIWVIKTRLMSQVGIKAPAEARPPWQYRGTIDAARKMYHSEGLRVFYSGLGPALLGLSHVAIQFPLYEYLKLQFTGLEMGENHAESEQKHYLVGISAATFISKVCATSATYPHEVLRTRLQTQQRTTPSSSMEEISFRGGMGHSATSRGPGTASSDGMINIPRYKGMLRTIKTIILEEGWRAFYSGMGTNLIRAVPAAMTTMLTYETLKTLVHRMQHEGREELARREEDRLLGPS
ncbi:mitochondrial folate transporter-like protein/carrier [Microthyrium microscopicum]|uniref:Mitochondrial folate transporter-like protein/carrier n=1 Tax=Microthyrium microscopicum TaxID=703497 RepID=A0A6A6TUR0_9PEZI|nr:mitochondrial folate transporter-like protein/carrier [Microthyrium microscopicum]